MNEISSGLSPWKKPRSVVLTKSKSMKRKSKSFADEPGYCENERSKQASTQNNPLSVIIENRNFNSNIFHVPKNTINDKPLVNMKNYLFSLIY